MKHLPIHRSGRRSRARLLLVLVAPVLIAMAPGLRAERLFASDEAGEERFEALVASTVARIGKRIEDYEMALRSGAELFSGKAARPSREAWSAWAAGLDVRRRFPEVEGVGYLRVVPPEERAALELALWDEGPGSFRIAPAGARDRYSAILYVDSPRTRNHQSVGYDLYAYPATRKAMERARALGRVALSEFVTELPPLGRARAPRFLAFYPVPSSAADPRNPAKAEPSGFVYLESSAAELFRAVIADTPEPLMLRVRETRWTGEEMEVYSNRGAFAANVTLRSRTLDMAVADRRWRVEIATPGDSHYFATGRPLFGLGPAAVALNSVLVALILVLVYQKRSVRRTARLRERELGRARARPERVLEAHVAAQPDPDQRLTGKTASLEEREGSTAPENQLLAMQSAWHGIDEALVIMDPQLRIIDANPAFSRISGYARDDVIGRTPRLYKTGSGDRSGYRDMLRTLKEKGAWEGRSWNTQKNGDVFVARERVWAIRDSQDTITHFVAAITDLTDSVLRENRRQNVAVFDQLTGLPNRTELHEAAVSSIAAAHLSGSVTAILYIDIDRFKAVNVRFDHTIGDELLIQVAERLRSLAASTDHVGRSGGDEFVMVLNDLLDESQVEEYAERVLAGLRGTYSLSNHQKVYVSASIGVSTFPRGGADCENLLRQADQAMYAAKDRGRDRYEIFDTAKSKEADEQRRQIKRIEYALKDEEFVLYYQPKINMRTGTVVGAEALLRWNHPEDGIIPPDEFLPLVAGSQQGAAIDRWVIGEALRQIEKLRSAGFEIPISVNVDSAYLQQVDFLEQLSMQLDAYPNLPRDLLELEILESVALSDLKNMGLVIDQLHGLGVSVALDDFGTGYSSLTYLKELPTDTLKIDKSFVIDMFNDASSFSLVEGIISLAGNFGRAVIAEGVETERHGLALVRMGCEHGQGYGIQHPLPVDKFVEWIKAQARDAAPGADEAGNVVWLGRPDGGKA